MNSQDFWNLIDAVHNESPSDMDQKSEVLAEKLKSLSPDDLVSFIRIFEAVDKEAYTWPLWGAAYVMNEGCSDDTFSDFRATLISYGQAIFYKTLADPDSLSELNLDDPEDFCYEGFQYVGSTVADEQSISIPEPSETFPDKPTGEEWEEESLDVLYPKLTAKNSSDIQVQQTPKKPWWKF